MWKLEKPTRTAEETYLACISRVKNPDLRRRLNFIKEDVVQASVAFEDAVVTTRLYTLRSSDNVAGQVSKDEMVAVYTDRMAKKDTPGRSIYEELISAPAYARCPLCGHRKVTTLDHHLPKTHYPALVVCPVNLIPSCIDCNKAKSNALPTCSEEETLHPYFDDIEDDLWLYAEVIETTPSAVRFKVKPPEHWDNVLSARVKGHFRLLKLAELYASHAAVEMINMRYSLSLILEEASPVAVKSHLFRQAQSCAKAFVNSWQTATYTALAESDWFCSGGFA
jgi:5-methylcytosine-specific restriction endonuclease McrA